jgi:hypothetical protein
MNKLILIALASAFMLAGCSKDAEYYSEHIPEAKSKLGECLLQENKRDDKECMAAAEGLQRATTKVINDAFRQFMGP